MNHTLQIVLHVLGTACSAVIIGWALWRWLKGSNDRFLLITRWVLTVVAILGIAAAGRLAGSGGLASVFAVFYALLCGLALAFIWGLPFVGWVGGLFGSLYDGGNVEPEKLPQYSVFHAKRTKGRYLEALGAVRDELEKFPTDFEGHMLLAQLQAEQLDDLPGAELTIARLVAQPGHLPVNVSYALNQLADWHLKIAKDRDAAQRSLEQIAQLLPNTEQSLQAAQRIGRLAGTEALLKSESAHTVVLKKGVENIGLMADSSRLKPAEVDLNELAADYVNHLRQHPLDAEVREKLAMIYANHYQRLDMALDQLEQLVQQPNSPAKSVVKWLNLMADLKMQHNAGFERVQETLQRIINLYPGQPAADNARRRLDILRLELKAKEGSRVVKLGTYEQNIGLKGRA
jgi:hypothetical protein